MEGTKLVHLFVVATTIVCPVTSLFNPRLWCQKWDEDE